MIDKDLLNKVSEEVSKSTEQQCNLVVPETTQLDLVSNPESSEQLSKNTSGQQSSDVANIEGKQCVFFLLY